jgi:drug/metabolite transporter (DMT)-like permease
VTAFALALVLASAVAHATWNLLAKRVEGGPAFLWAMSILSTILWAPVAAAVVIVVGVPGPIALVYAGVTCVLHTVYFLLLQSGYRVGDLSLVYPIARATGPLLATGAAIALFGERPTALALAGAVAIVLGALFLTGDPRKLGGSRAAVAYAVATGLVIAVYTLWDKQAVSVAAIPPILYDWGRMVGQAALTLPLALRRRDLVTHHFRTHRGELLGVAILGPLSYILVLTALAISPVSYVAPAREIGILFGALMGTRLLGEGDEPRRIAAALAMVAGVIALAVG